MKHEEIYLMMPSNLIEPNRKISSFKFVYTIVAPLNLFSYLCLSFCLLLNCLNMPSLQEQIVAFQDVPYFDDLLVNSLVEFLFFFPLDFCSCMCYAVELTIIIYASAFHLGSGPDFGPREFLAQLQESFCKASTCRNSCFVF